MPDDDTIRRMWNEEVIKKQSIRCGPLEFTGPEMKWKFFTSVSSLVSQKQLEKENQEVISWNWDHQLHQITCSTHNTRQDAQKGS